MEVLKLETWTGMFSPDEIVPDKVQEYLDFVVQAVERYDPSRYSEWHHVMPKCIDLDKKFRDQGVRINGADHFRAHRMLVECFVGKFRGRLSYALIRMKKKITDNGEVITPEEFEEVRRIVSSSISLDNSGEGNPFYGRHHTDESLRKIGQRSKGNSYNLGHYWTPEMKVMMSQLKSGTVVSEETRRKLSDSLKGNSNAKGKHWIHSEETCRRRSESLKGKPKSEDHRKHLSESCKNRVFNLTCQHCGESFTSRGSRTKYCENCK